MKQIFLAIVLALTSHLAASQSKESILLENIYSTIDSIFINDFGVEKYCQLRDSVDFILEFKLDSNFNLLSCNYLGFKMEVEESLKKIVQLLIQDEISFQFLSETEENILEINHYYLKFNGQFRSCSECDVPPNTTP